MPTYEYKCKDCGEGLEVVQSFSDDALTECPSCQGALKKVFGSIGISFKGSGFYKNDAKGKKKSSKAPASTSDGKSDSSDSSSSASSSDSGSSSSSSTGSSETKSGSSTTKSEKSSA